MRPLPILIPIVLTLLLLVFPGYAAVRAVPAPSPPPLGERWFSVSLNGERIYHVPGQRYYDVTNIDPTYGERWFCSEAEAREAGWRKSRV